MKGKYFEQKIYKEKILLNFNKWDMEDELCSYTVSCIYKVIGLCIFFCLTGSSNVWISFPLYFSYSGLTGTVLVALMGSYISCLVEIRELWYPSKQYSGICPQWVFKILSLRRLKYTVGLRVIYLFIFMRPDGWFWIIPFTLWFLFKKSSSLAT